MSKTLIRLIIVCLLAIFPFSFESIPANDNSAISVQDIIDGMTGRQSTIRTKKVSYSVTTTRTDLFYRTKRFLEFMQTNKKPEKSWEMVRQLDTARLENDELSQVVSSYDTLLSSDGRFLCTTYDHEILAQNDRFVRSTTRFEEGNVLTYNNERNIGGISSGNIQDCFPSESPESMFDLNGVSLLDFIIRHKSTFEILSISVADGDVICEMITKMKWPDTNTKIDTYTEYKIIINVSKDFWPVHIIQTRLDTDKVSGHSQAFLHSSVKTDTFTQSNNINYPSHITYTAYGNDMFSGKVFGPTLNEKATLIRTCVVTDLAINNRLSDVDFHFDFPAGSSFKDAFSNTVYVVDQNGKPMPKSQLLVSDYTKQDAFTILQAKGDREARLALRQTYVLNYILMAIGLTLICFAISNICYRIYLRKDRE